MIVSTQYMQSNMHSASRHNLPKKHNAEHKKELNARLDGAIQRASHHRKLRQR